MQRTTLEDFARAPVGRFVAGRTFVHFCAAPALWGVVLWGRPPEEDAVELGRSLVFELGAPARPHVSIIDTSRLEGCDVGAFKAAGRYLARHHRALGDFVQRVALIRPGGLSGAVVAGAYAVLPRPYPVQIFDSAAPALRWLGRDEGPELLDGLYEAATGVPSLVGSLRALLDDHLSGLDIHGAARLLDTSGRTLQRRLREAGTGFQRELAEARIRAATQQLLGGDRALTSIAYDVGCASLQHFSAIFRRCMGESPGAFRRRHAHLDP